MPSITIDLGPEIFSFPTYADWENGGREAYSKRRINTRNTIGVDRHGRLCAWSTHFLDRDSYPIAIFHVREDSRRALKMAGKPIPNGQSDWVKQKMSERAERRARRKAAA